MEGTIGLNGCNRIGRRDQKVKAEQALAVGSVLEPCHRRKYCNKERHSKGPFSHAGTCPVLEPTSLRGWSEGVIGGGPDEAEPCAGRSPEVLGFSTLESAQAMGWAT